MEEATNRLALGQLIIQFRSLPGFFHVYANAFILEQLQGLGTSPQHQLHPPAEHNHLAAFFKQLLHVRWLNPRKVLGVRLSPVPFAAAAGYSLKSLPEPRPSTSIRPQEMWVMRGDCFSFIAPPMTTA